MGVTDATHLFEGRRVRTYRDALVEIDRSLTVAIDSLERASNLGITFTPDLVRSYIAVLEAVRAFAELASSA